MATALRQVGLLAGAYMDDRGHDFATEVRTKRLEFGYFGNIARAGSATS